MKDTDRPTDRLTLCLKQQEAGRDRPGGARSSFLSVGRVWPPWLGDCDAEGLTCSWERGPWSSQR